MSFPYRYCPQLARIFHGVEEYDNFPELVHGKSRQCSWIVLFIETLQAFMVKVPNPHKYIVACNLTLVTSSRWRKSNASATIAPVPYFAIRCHRNRRDAREFQPALAGNSRRLRARILGGERQRNFRAPGLLRRVFLPRQLSPRIAEHSDAANRLADRLVRGHGLGSWGPGGGVADRLGFRRALSLAYLILGCAYFLLGSLGASWMAPVRASVPLLGLVAFVLVLPALGIAMVKRSEERRVGKER